MSNEQRAPRILVVEDDPSIQLGLRMNLERAGYVVGVAEDGSSGLERLRSEPWDVCILDIMLPKLNGYEVLRLAQAENIHTSVLVLSARSDERDRVVGLDLGAEDYVVKPFSVPELLARVRAALRRRNGPVADESKSFGKVTVDLGSRQVSKEGHLVELTATEFNVLATLVKAHGRTLTRQQIFETVWGTDHHGTYRTIDNFVAQLRSKLEDDPAEPAHLITVRGVGYRLAS
jgi:DNA-binding response OmpR family regulator